MTAAPHPQPVSLWSAQHQALSDALAAEVLLPRLRQVLDLTGSSEKADRDLLAVLLREPGLDAGFAALHAGDLQPLRAALVPSRALTHDRGCVYPVGLSSRALHHVSLVFLGQAHRRGAGLLGWLWLWDRHRPYLCDLARAAAHDQGPVDEVVDGVLPHVLADEISHFAKLGTDSGTLQAGDTWQMLSSIAATLGKLGAVAAQSALGRVLDEAAAAAIERAKADTEKAFLATERAVLNGQTPDLEAALRPARRLIDHIGHHEALSIWVVQRCVTLGWVLYKRDDTSALNTLGHEASAFAHDLEARLKAGQAFGFQGDFADFMVLQAGATTDEALKQSLLRRALKLCPIHRNTAVTLASSNLRLASVALRAADAPLARAEAAAQHVRDAERLIEEAARLRPEHERLKTAQETLASIKKRLVRD